MCIQTNGCHCTYSHIFGTSKKIMEERNSKREYYLGPFLLVRAATGQGQVPVAGRFNHLHDQVQG